MKNKKYHTFRTVKKSNRKTVETEAKWIPLNTHERSWLIIVNNTE